MNDLISRQAAIDAVMDTDWYHQNYKKDMVHGANSSEHQAWYKAEDVYKALEQLPSVQPEVIRCKECEWFRKEYGWNCIEYTVCGVSPTHHPIRREDDFCSHAERRTDD